MSDTQKPSGDKPKRKLFHEEFAEKIIAQLEMGIAPWQRPWHPGAVNLAPHNPASGTVYKGVNRLSLSMSSYDDPRWMTVKQANDKGMRIMPGSKATPVVYYQFTEEKDRLDEEGKPVLGEDGKALKKTVELDRPIMRVAHVFNGEQIEGMPPLQLTDKSFEWNPIEKGESILAASGATIKHDQSNQAFYRGRTDSIHLPPRENFEDAEKYYGTALHELGHWTKHPDRLNREGGPFGSEQYAREELRAEIASWMLAQDTGIPHDPGQHAAYVQSWIKVVKEDPFEIQRACRDAEQIKEYLLGMERQKELGQEQPLRPDREEGIAAKGLPENPASEKTYLSVPYKEKDKAKALGAKWDKEVKSWFVPEGTDLAALQAWLPENSRATPEVPRPLSPEQEFAKALAKAGMDLQGQEPVLDGEIHRVPLLPSDNIKVGLELGGAYCGYGGEQPYGWSQNFATGEKTPWIATGHELSQEQIRQIYREREAERQKLEERMQGMQNDIADTAFQTMNGTEIASRDHPFLHELGIEPYGVHQDAHTLYIPMRNIGGEIRNLQIIEGEESRFLIGGERDGLFHLITGPQQNEAGLYSPLMFKENTLPGIGRQELAQGEIILAENYASGASLHMATGKPVAVAFTAENLTPVAEALRKEFPNAAVTICACNHQYERTDGTVQNRGVIEAERAAQAVGGRVVVPGFTENEKALSLVDFNDLHVSRGLEEVKRQFDGPALDKTQETEKSRNKAQDTGRGLEL